MTADPFSRPEAASRRARPVKPPLSRDAIVVEALRQLRAGGLEGMSLRKVAAALDTGAASLYAYVDDLDALYALVLDRALADVETRFSARAGWRDRLIRVLESYARTLASRPGLAQLAFGRVALGPNALRIIETILSLLIEGGVARATAAWAVDLLLLYVTAIVAEHSGGTKPVPTRGAFAAALRGVSESTHPQLSAARHELLSGKPNERFRWAIESLLQGILHNPRRPKDKPR